MAKRRFVAKSSAVSKDPFDEVKLVSFSFAAKNRDDTAYLQYNLLLKPEVLQAHLDFEAKRGTAVCIPAFDLAKELSELGVSPKMLLVEWIPYKEYQKRNVSCFL